MSGAWGSLRLMRIFQSQNGSIEPFYPCKSMSSALSAVRFAFPLWDEMQENRTLCPALASNFVAAICVENSPGLENS